jgi:hypothetical protein
MTTQFQPNTLAFGDAAGLGAWLVGHYRQHLAYNDFLAAKSPPVILSPYNILTIEGGKTGRRFWLEDHASWHGQIRPYANVTGIDLASVDMDDEAQFYGWIDLHNQEHAEFDVAFGLA